jgi:hypothetical protein
MTPADLVKALQQGDVAEVDNRDVLALYDVFEGYCRANGSIRPLLNSLSARFEGPGSASAFTKAYLSSNEASDRIFDELGALLANEGDKLTPARTAFTERGFPAAAAEAIVQGRPGLLLAEPTILCLSRNWTGFVLGASAVDPQLGERQSHEALHFDDWVRRRFDTPTAHWSRVLRIFGGVGSEGLASFASRWAEFSTRS